MPGNAWDFLDESNLLFRPFNQSSAALMSLKTFKTKDPNILFPRQDLEDNVYFDLSRDRSRLVAIREVPKSKTNTVAQVYQQTDGQWNLQAEISFPWIRDRLPQLLRLAPDGGSLLSASSRFSAIHSFTNDGKPVDICHDHRLCSMVDAFWLGESDTLLGAHYGSFSRGRTDAIQFLRRWDPRTGAPTKTQTHPTLIQAMAMEPGESRFAEAGLGGRIRIRNTVDFEIIREFRAHDAPVVALAWHPTLPILASVSSDRIIRFWNVDTVGFLSERYGIASDPTAMKFSPEGNWIAVSTGSPEFLLRIWKTANLGSNPR